MLQGTSSLTVKGSDLSIKPAVATPYECIREEGAGSLVLEDTKIHGCSTGINSVIPAILSLLRAEIYNNSFAGMNLGFGTWWQGHHYRQQVSTTTGHSGSDSEPAVR